MSEGLKRIHHVEFVVGNAKQAAFFYRNAFGFDQVAWTPGSVQNKRYDLSKQVDEML